MGMVFCRGCGKDIHETAQTCPQCGAPQGAQATPVNGGYTSYEQVPWYRKNWFAICCALLFPLGLLIIIANGDIYYERSGKLKTYSTGAKVFLILLIIGVIVSFVVGGR